jgi:hypothetical protein
MGPVLAPTGTLVINCVDVADTTVAVVPLKLTLSLASVALKP